MYHVQMQNLKECKNQQAPQCHRKHWNASIYQRKDHSKLSKTTVQLICPDVHIFKMVPFQIHLTKRIINLYA